MLNSPMAMEWHVQYSLGSEHRVEMHRTPEAAIEAACSLIDDGCDVYGIGTGALTDTIDPIQIRRIHDLWAREKYPFNHSLHPVG
jgi:hypothetical protein